MSKNRAQIKRISLPLKVCHLLITPVHYPHRTQRIFAFFQMTLVLPIQKACPSSPKLRLSFNTNPNPKIPPLYIPPVLNALAMNPVALQSPPSTSHVLPTSSHLVRDIGQWVREQRAIVIDEVFNDSSHLFPTSSSMEVYYAARRAPPMLRFTSAAAK